MKYTNITNRDDLKTQNRIEGFKQLAVLPIAFATLLIGTALLMGGLAMPSVVAIIAGITFVAFAIGGFAWVFYRQHEVHKFNQKIKANL